MIIRLLRISLTGRCKDSFLHSLNKLSNFSKDRDNHFPYWANPSIHIFIRNVLPWSTNTTQCLAAHYFDRPSTCKQFCWLMVGQLETLTVGLVETLSNSHFFFIEGKIRFPYFLKVDYQDIIRLNIKITPYDSEELVDWFTQPISQDLGQQNGFAGRWEYSF